MRFHIWQRQIDIKIGRFHRTGTTLTGEAPINQIQVQPNLNEFIRKCAARNIQVALSTWWREDKECLALHNKKPGRTGYDLGRCWIA